MHVIAYEGKSYHLTGIRGQSGKVKGCTVGLQEITDDREPTLLCTPDSLVASDTQENHLSLAQLLYNCYKVDFATGRDSDLQYGVHITTPSGQKITMIFSNNSWQLPLWVPATKALH